MPACDACNGTGTIVDLSGYARDCHACDTVRMAREGLRRAFRALGLALNDYWRGDDERRLSPAEWRALAAVLEDVETRGLAE
jgi:hypothetical protein